MKIRKKFLQLTKHTYPHGTEGFLKNYLPLNYKIDDYGNFYYLIGDKPTTMFACHLDTVSSVSTKVNHIQKDNIIKTDGNTILGADDKAGMTILLYMISKKKPGLYYFFIGEEVGCVGSSSLSKNWNKSEYSKTINKIISFDRRGEKSIITHQFFQRCCSDEFAKELSNRLNNCGEELAMDLDDGGLLTDSAEFMDIVPECTNISVGYMNEHTFNEEQNIYFLQKMCRASVKIDWETLPIKRDYRIYEGLYGNYNSYNINDDSVDLLDKYDWPSDYYSYFLINGINKKMYISKTKIKKERENISDYLKYNGFNNDFTWNGNSLYYKNDFGEQEFWGSRFDLDQVDPSICYVTLDDISENKYGVFEDYEDIFSDEEEIFSRT